MLLQVLEHVLDALSIEQELFVKLVNQNIETATVHVDVHLIILAIIVNHVPLDMLVHLVLLHIAKKLTLILLVHLIHMIHGVIVYIIFLEEDTTLLAQENVLVTIVLTA